MESRFAHRSGSSCSFHHVLFFRSSHTHQSIDRRRVVPSVNVTFLFEIDSSGTQSHLKTLWNDLKVILSHPVYSITMFGNIFQRGVMVALTYWGPRAAESMFDRTDIDYWIGGLVLSSGILGSILSGWIVDKMGASIPNALKAGYLTCIANAVFLTPTFLFIQSFYASLFPFFIVFVTMFMQTVSLENMNEAIQWCCLASSYANNSMVCSDAFETYSCEYDDGTDLRFWRNTYNLSIWSGHG